jgi:hypothetical protein
MAKPIDYMDPTVQQTFELDIVYRIQLKDKRMIDFRLIEIRGDRLLGVQKNNKIKEGTEIQGQLEIPFERIFHVEEKMFNVFGSLGVIGGIYLLLAIIILDLSNF